MTAGTHERGRRLAVARRRAPGEPVRLRLTAGGDGDRGDEFGPPPDELHLETTGERGELAAWFHDSWWLETLRRWRDRCLSVHVLPTPGALAHPVVLHQLDMLWRVVPAWRLIGSIHLAEITDEALLERLALGPCHELRVIDGGRPGPGGRVEGVHFSSSDELFAAMRKIQVRCGATRPSLTRVPTAGDEARRAPHLVCLLDPT